ncbi:MAG: carboxypeptidase-like regulatory domain-containing protein, partial [Planctomycetes bacterium]|nr:carboxypeptidase-like regulatory domain-containing protein [Planctomycetota bacterium]
RFPRGSTLTDTDGYYMLAGVHRPPKPDPDSEETICLSGEGGLIASARGFQSEHEYPDEGGITNFKLEKGARVTGRIVDAAGKPVAGASVSASHASPSPPDVQTTGGDGRFMVEDLAGGAVSLLVVRADGSGQLELEFDTPAIGELVDLGDIALAAAGAIAGRVLSAEGNPAPGVTVVLNGSEADRLRLRPGASPETESPEHRVRTDDLGRFAFPGLAPGSFTLVAYGEREETSRAVPLAAGANAEVELRLPPVLRFRVLVVDEAGVPQAGVQIDGSHGGNDRGNGGSSYRDTTDADGVAHFICGTRRPFVEIRSGPPGWRFLRPPPIPVPPGASEVRIVVVAARPTSGVVVDESGAPVGHAEVAAWRGEDLLGSGFSEANGEFSILLAEGLLVELRLTGEVFVPEDHHRETQLLLGSLGGVRPGDTGLRISARRPPRDTRLALRFVGPGNVPAPGCRIQLRGPGIDEDRTLGPDGCVQFEAMPRVPLRLTVFPPDDSGLCWWAGRVTPTGEEQTIALSRELRFTGKAVRSDGKPAGSVKVEVRAGGRVCDWTYAEDDGTFVLSIPEGTQGPFTLFAWGENSDWVGSVEVGKAGEPVKIELTLEK